MSNQHDFTPQEIAIDRYIRTGVLSLRKDANTLEPTRMFTENVMAQARQLERQRNIKMTFLFVFIATAPFLGRQLWFLVRNNYISVSDLPFANLLTSVYKLFLSSGSAYALAGGGLVLAVYIVGLPKWRLPYLHHLSKHS